MQIQNFDDAFTLLIGNEGGYSNNPKDPGGETMWGITKKVAEEEGYEGRMKDFPQEIAKEIAKRRYWDPLQLDEIPPEIAFQVFDTNYNGGHAAVWLQQACQVKNDGDIGPVTIEAANTLDPRSIIMRFDAYRIRYLCELRTWPTFGHGWMERIANNLVEGAD